MVYLGTCGYNHEEWAGTFYPPGLPRRDWLSHYSREFNACEIDSTFYAIPPPSLVNYLVRQSSPGFQFSLKTHHDMTHLRQGNENVFRDFLRSVEPLGRSGKLGCVLAQFPVPFSYTRQNLDYLLLFRERLGEVPLVAEFRHESWLHPAAMESLRRHRIGLCWLDTPPFLQRRLSPADASPLMAYLRLHEADAICSSLPELRTLPRKVDKTFIFAYSRVWTEAFRAIRRLKDWLSGDNPPDKTADETGR